MMTMASHNSAPCIVPGSHRSTSLLQGMKETYSTYMDSIQAALDGGGGGNGSGGRDGPLASQSEAAAAAQAAVNSVPAVGNGAAAGVSSPVLVRPHKLKR